MSGNEAPERQSTAPETGLVGSLRTLAAAAVSYIAARLRLAGLESGEAAWHFLWILIWISVALLAAVLGYVLLLVSAVFLLSRWTGWAWEWVLLATAGAHFAAVIVCALTVRGRLQIPVFSATIQEFKRDQEWLKTTTKQRQS
jgi:uncharacterized membrane protein YqjE